MSPLRSETFLRGPERASIGHLIAAAILVLGCFGATAAGASDRGRAERLYTKGLAELHAGRSDAAIALFQQAVTVDPTDVHGLYYRALGYGHVGRYEEAVADLKVVVAANDPSIDRDRLELGYALYRLGRYDEAVAELEIASKKAGPSAGEATMLLGIVETRRGNDDAARAALSKVESMDPAKAVPARYYRGLAAYRSGDESTATEQFTWVKEHGGGTPFGREATAFLDRMGGGSSRPYQLHAGFALEYDSNVALAPDDGNLTNNVLGISNKDDGRAVITAGGKYALVHTPNFHLSVGYDFLTSLHFDLERFDVQTHRVGADAQYVWGPLTFGLWSGYEHSFLDEESLLNGGTVLPWIRYDEGDLGRAEVYYRARRRDYVEAPFDPVRDSWNHAVGGRQFFNLGSRSRTFVIGYRYDTDVADTASGKQYDYDGNQVEAGFEWLPADDLILDAIYAYKHENYSAASQNRDDDIHLVIARAEKRVSEYVWVIGSYVYDRNNSDQKFFDYDRHITSLGVEVRY